MGQSNSAVTFKSLVVFWEIGLLYSNCLQCSGSYPFICSVYVSPDLTQPLIPPLNVKERSSLSC